MLATIPRAALLNAANSSVAAALLRDGALHRQMTTMNSWVPLLLALLTETDKKVAVKKSFSQSNCLFFRPLVSGGHIWLWYLVKEHLAPPTSGLQRRGVNYYRGRGWRRGCSKIWWTSRETIATSFFPSCSVILSSASRYIHQQGSISAPTPFLFQLKIRKHWMKSSIFY